MTRPNILFITADQLGAKWLGCYGSGVDSTPNLDRLALVGVRFDRHYATHPICAPNRATMLTGRSANAHGIVSNNYALATDMPTYAHVLRDHGYETAGFGKFHQTPMAWPVPTDLGFLGFDRVVVSEDPKWGPYIDWVRKNHPEQYDNALAVVNGHSGHRAPSARVDAAQGADETQIGHRAKVYDRILGGRIADAEWERMYISPIDPAAHDSTFITDCALDFLEHRASSGPFLCHVSYVEPHDPYDPPEPYASRYSASDMPAPEPPEWEHQGPACLSRVGRSYLNFARIAGDEHAVLRLRALYHGQLRFLDEQIGRLVASLKSTGLWDDTIVVFSTDHGEHLGDHGMIAKGYPHYDAGIRCPLIVAGGRVERDGADGVDRQSTSPANGRVEQSIGGTGAGRASNRLSCPLDLFPSFCDWAGIPTCARPPLEGVSFAGEAGGVTSVATPRGEVDGEAGCVPVPPSAAGRGDARPASRRSAVLVTAEGASTVITDDGYRLTRYPDAGEGQLFNLADDPHEQHNLYGDPKQAALQARLYEEMTACYVNTCTTPQYRNLPVRDGTKWGPNGSRQFRLYATRPSPWLTPGATRPEWNGSDRP